MERLDTMASATYLKALVYGPPGTGKTWIGCTAPNALILLSELQGMHHIAEWAAIKKRPRPPTLHMKTLEDYRNVERALHGAKNEPFVVRDRNGLELLRLDRWPETIVIDSITDAMEKLFEELLETSPPVKGKNGLPILSQQHWSEFKTRSQRLIKRFRDAPVHVVFIALVDDTTTETSDGEARRTVQPMMPMRKLPPALGAAVNVIGLTCRAQDTKDVTGPDGKVRRERSYRHFVMTKGPDFILLKPNSFLLDQEEPDFSVWLAKTGGLYDSNADAPIPEMTVAQLEANGLGAEG